MRKSVKTERESSLLKNKNQNSIGKQQGKGRGESDDDASTIHYHIRHVDSICHLAIGFLNGWIKVPIR
ncbi:unnamed protein product [Lactuca virosa]|uniref:Uncharacterized protein n=1 Tax=Lactuca virosa TaxID=75947 RepID=A0AAU9PIH8_9ASTR|nr:unnamed protein product [Lactuca virosa]